MEFIQKKDSYKKFNMSKIQKKLQELSEGHTSSWSEEADFRIKNQKWLRYSGNIALRVLAAIEDKEGLSQKKLAEILDVSPQQISKIIKGQENLTLETIAKLSEALNIELISFPEFKYSTRTQTASSPRTRSTTD
jgi:ribosome-binding protein aMBF1 (putative translation factor)